MKYVIGLDLAQSSDFTAVAVLDTDGPPAHIVKLERARGEPYTTISARTRKMMITPPLLGASALVVDATGVGVAVIDLLRAEGLNPVPVVLHGGEAATHENGSYRTPKRDVVAALQVALQQGTLKLAEGLALAAVLVQELSAYRMKLSQSGHDSYENWRADSPHDDLVLAVALACWWWRQSLATRPLSSVQQPMSPSRFAGTLSGGRSRWS